MHPRLFHSILRTQGRSGRDYVEKIWADDEWTRGCYGAFFPRIPGRPLAMPCAHLSARSTGRERKLRRVGWATWTEQSARVNERLPRCCTIWRDEQCCSALTRWLSQLVFGQMSVRHQLIRLCSAESGASSPAFRKTESRSMVQLVRSGHVQARSSKLVTEAPVARSV